MSLELRRQGVRVTTFCPGPISTDILGSAVQGAQMRCHRKIWPKRSPIWLKFHQRLKYRSYWFNQHHDGNKYRCGSQFLQSYRPLFSSIKLGENYFLREESADITSARLRYEGLRSNQEYYKRGIQRLNRLSQSWMSIQETQTRQMQTTHISSWLINRISRRSLA